MRGEWLASRWWIAALWLVGCGGEGPANVGADAFAVDAVLADAGPPPVPDAGLDAAADDAAPFDAGRPDAGLDGGPTCTVGLEGPLTRWPEPLLVIDDPSTETGLRLRFDPDEYPDLVARLRGYAAVFERDLGELDGFGVNAEAYFQFGRAFDPAMLPAPEASPVTAGFVVVGAIDGSPGTPRIVRSFVRTTDNGATLLLAPLTPLPAQARAAVFVTRGLTDAAGGCLEPSAETTALLANPDPETASAISALTSLGVITSASDLVAITAFPTQSTVDDSVAVATDIESRDIQLTAPATCTPETSWIRCEATFTASDYRDSDGVFRRAGGQSAPEVASYEVPVTFWLPLTGTPPYPILMFGHGLAGDRYQAQQLARFAAPQGFATVAIDALEHGDHPSVTHDSDNTIQVLFEFFAVMGTTPNGSRLRDNFRQSAWDRVQLARMIETHPDIDGDGVDDLDPGRFGYLGVSLGGIMGPEVLALTDSMRAAVLAVPGGRVSSIISESPMFAPLITLLAPAGTSPGDVRRFFPVLQTVLDRGDSASFAPHLLRDRLPLAAARVPSVLVGIVLDDGVVPNVSNYVLARAIDLPIVEPVLRPEPGLISVPGPIMGNAAGGAATAGIVQFDVIGDGMGGSRTATHDNVGASDVGREAWLDFLRSELEGGPARIRDPYAAIGLAHPPP